MDEALMEAIKNFFVGLPGGDKYGLDVVNLNTYTTKSENHKKVIQLTISRVDYIKNIFITFFEGLDWHSKKRYDFLDWVTIFKLKERGHHHHEEGVRILNLILSQMNNNRLSTFKSTDIKVNREELLKDISMMLSGPSNYEIKDGRTIIKSLNRVAGVSKHPNVLLQQEKGSIIKTFYSVSECAKYLGVSRTVVYDRIDNGKAILFDNKRIYIFRDSKG